VPVGSARFTIGVQLGKLFEFVQVASVQFRPVAAVIGQAGVPGTATIPATPTLEGIETVAPGILRCHDRDGFMMVPPPAGAFPQGLVLELVFRPIAERAPVQPATVPAIAAGSIA
jgi:hypothetical protein